jgi:hypothetical protein
MSYVKATLLLAQAVFLSKASALGEPCVDVVPNACAEYAMSISEFCSLAPAKVSKHASKIGW